MRDVYDECLRAAARSARHRDEADDLVQTVFLYALEHGVDLDAPERRAWLRGALRRRAAFEARLAGRRRKRETQWLEAREPAAPPRPWHFSSELLAQLQPSVRALAVLASADLNADEIQSILQLSATALRKRLSVLRRSARKASAAGQTVTEARRAVHALGAARASVIASLRRRPHAVLGSHDPDGHPLLFAVRAEKK